MMQQIKQLTIDKTQMGVIGIQIGVIINIKGKGARYMFSCCLPVVDLHSAGVEV